MGPVVYQKSCQWPHTTLQGISSLLITVMDDWEQPHNNATLLKPAKHCHSVFRALQSHEKPSGKADLAIYGHSIVVSGCSYKVSQ